MVIIHDKYEPPVGVIFCGGASTRYGDGQKCLTTIHDEQTILHKQLFDLKNELPDISEIYLLTGYGHQQVKDVIGDEYSGIEIKYSKDKKPKQGTMRALYDVITKFDIKNHVLLRNGDIITDANIRELTNDYFKKKDLTEVFASMFITPLQVPVGIVDYNSDYITKFSEKPTLDACINGGIYFLDKSLTDTIRTMKTKGNIENILFPKLVDEKKLTYFLEKDIFWQSVETRKDVGKIKKEYYVGGKLVRTDKPWGYERVISDSEKYLGKILYIKGGHQTSYHKHEKKDETLFCNKGKGRIEFEDSVEQFSARDTIRITPGTPHTIVAEENTEIVESSTHHPNDVTRIRDYYER